MKKNLKIAIAATAGFCLGTILAKLIESKNDSSAQKIIESLKEYDFENDTESDTTEEVSYENQVEEFEKMLKKCSLSMKDHMDYVPPMGQVVYINDADYDDGTEMYKIGDGSTKLYNLPSVRIKDGRFV